MGTFTFSYAFKKIVIDRKFSWLTAAVAIYIGRCWDKAGMHKAEMMKGRSIMYADKTSTFPKHVDPWKY
uniref:Complex I-MNLL n=1 Tax=Parastrongyloides trichosuri TaxID=131310 RepID=A0A0N4ZSA9_PARTI